MFYEEFERIKEREDRIQYMLNKEKNSRLNAPGTSLDPELDIDKLELKELRKKWNDSDFV